ncbi:MAG: isochorismatase family protein [Planctomycetia bacterium]|nr:isochorismatase family protein [Planctomycetia bacterium]
MVDLKVENTLLTIIDMQEKLVPVMENPELVTKKVGILVRAAREMSLEVVVTQQYPKGLGDTLAVIQEALPPESETVDKVCFSCFDSPKYRSVVEKKGKKNLIFVGVEAHVCVMMTAVAAVDAGYTVWVLNDAINSRTMKDRLASLGFMRSQGVNLISTESLIFLLLKTAAHPAFKSVQALLK